MGQCQSSCKRQSADSAASHSKAAKHQESKVLNPPPLKVVTNRKIEIASGETEYPPVVDLATPMTVSTVSTSSPFTPSESISTTNTSEQHLSDTSSKGEDGNKRSRRRRRMKQPKKEDHFPVAAPRSKKAFTPIVPLEETCKTEMIPEERDPEAPSDEEDAQRGVDLQRMLEEPHLRHQKSAWVQTIQTGVSPLSIQIPPALPIPPGKQSVHPDAYNHFQKLKIRAKVAEQHTSRQMKINAAESQRQKAHEERDVWKNYQTIQAVVEKKGMSTKQIIEGDSELEDDDMTGPRRRKKKGKKKSRRPKLEKSKSEQFDLSDSDSWFFDFQAQDFETDSRCVDVDPNKDEQRSQASLSLLSEASMEAQKRLFARKAQERKSGITKGRKGAAGSVSGASASSAATNSQFDYGPPRKGKSPASGNILSPAESGLEVAFPSPSVSRVEDDPSYVSDLNDEYSIGNSSIHSHGLRNDYRVSRRKTKPPTPSDNSDSRNVVDPRFEETVKALQSDQEDAEGIIKSRLSIAVRLDKLEAKLAKDPRRNGNDVHTTSSIEPSTVFSPMASPPPDHVRVTSIPPVAATPTTGTLALHSNSNPSPDETPTISNARPAAKDKPQPHATVLSPPVCGRFGLSSADYEVSSLDGIKTDGLSSIASESASIRDELTDEENEKPPEGIKDSQENSADPIIARLARNSQDSSPAAASQPDIPNPSFQSNDESTNPKSMVGAMAEPGEDTNTSVTSSGSGPRITPRNTADRIRVLAQLVNNSSTTSQPRDWTAGKYTYQQAPSPPRNLSQSGHSADARRESSVPSVFGLSTHEFLQCSEENAFERARQIERMIRSRNEKTVDDTEKKDLPLEVESDSPLGHSPSIPSDDGSSSDSSCSDFGDIRRVGNESEQQLTSSIKSSNSVYSRDNETSEFGDSTLQRVEKVQRQVKTVLNNYKDQVTSS